MVLPSMALIDERRDFSMHPPLIHDGWAPSASPTAGHETPPEEREPQEPRKTCSDNRSLGFEGSAPETSPTAKRETRPNRQAPGAPHIRRCRWPHRLLPAFGKPRTNPNHRYEVEAFWGAHGHTKMAASGSSCRLDVRRRERSRTTKKLEGRAQAKHCLRTSLPGFQPTLQSTRVRRPRT